MKNFKTTIAILTTLIVMVSCSKDDPAPDPSTFQYRLKEERDQNNVLKKSYQYNDRNQVVKELDSKGELDKEYVYNNAGFLVNKLVDKIFTSYVLNDTGRILEEITTFNSGDKNKTIYEYNPAGKIIEEKHYKFISASNVFRYEYNTTYDYNSSNQLAQLLTLEYIPIGRSDPNFEQTLDYTYDNRGNISTVVLKKAPVSNGNTQKVQELKLVHDNMKPSTYTNSFVYNAGITLPKNNLIEYTAIEYDRNGAIKTNYTVLAKHTFNEAGYITKTVGGIIGEQNTTNYILEKIN